MLLKVNRVEKSYKKGRMFFREKQNVINNVSFEYKVGECLGIIGESGSGKLTFIPLYAMQLESGNAGIYLMLQAGTVVFARFALRKTFPSDGKWHSPFIMLTMLLLATASLCVSFSITGGALFFYVGAFLMGIAQAIIYPTLTTYLTFVLPKINRNVLLGLFIAMADLGV